MFMSEEENVLPKGGCAALSGRVPWSAVLLKLFEQSLNNALITSSTSSAFSLKFTNIRFRAIFPVLIRKTYPYLRQRISQKYLTLTLIPLG